MCTTGRTSWWAAPSVGSEYCGRARSASNLLTRHYFVRHIPLRPPGLALAMLAYRQYYPWPWGKGAELPYPDPDLDVPGTPQPLQAYRSTDETMRVV